MIRKKISISIKKYDINYQYVNKPDLWSPSIQTHSRKALSPASLHKAFKSAPTYPWALFASCNSSASVSIWGTLWSSFWRISSRSAALGTPISISLSNRPGLRSAASKAWGRFVAPRTNTCPSLPSLQNKMRINYTFF